MLEWDWRCWAQTVTAFVCGLGLGLFLLLFDRCCCRDAAVLGFTSSGRALYAARPADALTGSTLAHKRVLSPYPPPASPAAVVGGGGPSSAARPSALGVVSARSPVMLRSPRLGGLFPFGSSSSGGGGALATPSASPRVLSTTMPASGGFSHSAVWANPACAAALMDVPRAADAAYAAARSPAAKKSQPVYAGEQGFVSAMMAVDDPDRVDDRGNQPVVSRV